MKKELAAKREKILKKISIEEYRGLLKFVEDVYLAEDALKILLAKKCSNLFFALLELAREEDGGRVRYLYQEKFSEGTEPIVISDRALDYYADDIREGRFKQILISDDVIIHGTTIAQLYERLESLVKTDESECKINVRAYAVNKKNLLEKPYLKNVVADKKCDTQELRVITDEIIDIFRVTGQPFTSYVPNIFLSENLPLWEQIRKFAKESKKMVDEPGNPSFPTSYAWIDSDKWNFAVFQSMRFYLNDDLGQCIIAPMVSLMPIREEVLVEYGKILKRFISANYYAKEFSSFGDLDYRVIVYVVSSLWCRLFFLKQFGAAVPAENSSVERVNFGKEILDHEKLDALGAEEIQDVLHSLERVYQKVDSDVLLELNTDFNILQEKWRLAVSKRDSEAVMFFLRANGELEEDMWKKREDDARIRLDGYPLCFIPDKEDEAYHTDILVQILTAIDFGYGSVITKTYRKDNIVYYVSLLHSGERNYKYTEIKHFPFLYGLFEIEKAVGNAADKHRFMEEYIKAAEDSGMESTRDTLEKLCAVNVTQEYKSVLIRDAWYYSEQEQLEAAISLADKVLENSL